MIKNLPKKKKLLKYYPIIVFAASLLIFIFLLYNNFIINKNTTIKDNVIKREILINSKGEPLYATGNCSSENYCFRSGCSRQICANHEITTTCEILEIPDLNTYSCGCVNQRCVWYR
jgi:eight-cysteine-cluster-containing protein